MITEKEIGCDNCYYSYFDEKAYPCSLCVRGIERTDKWQPNKKTKADRKTEPSGYKMKPVEQIEPQTDEPTWEQVKEYCNKRCLDIVDSAMRKQWYKDEPQTDADQQAQHIESVKDETGRWVRVGQWEWEHHTDTTHFGKAKGESITTNKVEDKPQTETEAD